MQFLVIKFLDGLTTPSLQEFHISLRHEPHGYFFGNITKFISSTGIHLISAQLNFQQDSLTLSVLAPSYSIDDPPFTIHLSKQSSIAWVGVTLSAVFAAVEDFSLTFLDPIWASGPFIENPREWHAFFSRFRNVKALRIHQGIEMEVANMLPQDDQPPSNYIDPSNYPRASLWPMTIFHIPRCGHYGHGWRGRWLWSPAFGRRSGTEILPICELRAI